MPAITCFGDLSATERVLNTFIIGGIKIKLANEERSKNVVFVGLDSAAWLATHYLDSGGESSI